MADIIEGVKPTRMELLKLSRRTNLAGKGHKLLKEKRDALITEFLEVAKRVRNARKNVESKLKEAYNDLFLAQLFLGTGIVEDISGGCGQDINIDFTNKNIMGVKVPLLSVGKTVRKLTKRGYGLADTHCKLDEAARNFEEALELIVKLAEIEETVKKIAREVEKTKRRVNALEYIVIPRLQATVKYIRMRLEEMERESFIRLKHIKATLEVRE